MAEAEALHRAERAKTDDDESERTVDGADANLDDLRARRAAKKKAKKAKKKAEKAKTRLDAIADSVESLARDAKATEPSSSAPTSDDGDADANWRRTGRRNLPRRRCAPRPRTLDVRAFHVDEDVASSLVVPLGVGGDGGGVGVGGVGGGV